MKDTLGFPNPVYPNTPDFPNGWPDEAYGKHVIFTLDFPNGHFQTHKTALHAKKNGAPGLFLSISWRPTHLFMMEMALQKA